MNLDERIRSELRDAVDSPTLRTDEALDHVRARHRARSLRKPGSRCQAVAIAVALSLSASVAVVVSWRNVPDRFRSTTTLRVATVDVDVTCLPARGPAPARPRG